uniref:Cilia-and flagella-associated protein 96 n=1 Tax=Poecilia reticulata TaxID=8081 RepID=A0A3P9QGV5_POERE
MQVGVTKQPCALKSGFFDKSFKRIFEKEALSEPLRLARRNRMQQAKKNLGKAFLPCSGTKKPLFAPLATDVLKPQRTAAQIQHELICKDCKELIQFPAGSHFYLNFTYMFKSVCIRREVAIHHFKLRDGPFRINLHPQDYFQVNRYRNHKALPPTQKPPQPQKNVSTVPFRPPSPSKRIGGMKTGTFDVYPSHSADPYVIHRSKPVNQEPVFRPAPGPKSMPVKSIISVNVDRLAPLIFSNYFTNGFQSWSHPVRFVNER